MPYAPTVNDISGQILAQGQLGAAQAKAQGILGQAQALYTGQVQAANTRLQGIQALASGISQAGQGIAGGIGELGREFNRQKLINENVFGKLDAYQQLGLMSPQTADHIAGLKGDKMAAAMAVYDQFLQNSLQDQSVINRYRAQQLIDQQLDRTGQLITNYDPVTHQPITAMRTSDRQAQVLQPKAPEHRIIGSQTGFFDYVPGSGQPPTPIPDPQTGQPLQPRAQQQPNLLLSDPNGIVPGAPGGAPAATPATPAVTPSPAAGGYQIGAKYRMPNGQVLTYRGGDPRQPTSWSQ